MRCLTGICHTRTSNWFQQQKWLCCLHAGPELMLCDILLLNKHQVLVQSGSEEQDQTCAFTRQLNPGSASQQTLDYIQCLIKVFNMLKLEFQGLSSVVWEFGPVLKNTVLCRCRHSGLWFFSRMSHVARELTQKPVLNGIFRWMNCSPVVWSGWTCLVWPKFSSLHAWCVN